MRLTKRPILLYQGTYTTEAVDHRKLKGQTIEVVDDLCGIDLGLLKISFPQATIVSSKGDARLAVGESCLYMYREGDSVFFSHVTRTSVAYHMIKRIEKLKQQGYISAYLEKELYYHLHWMAMYKGKIDDETTINLILDTLEEQEHASKTRDTCKALSRLPRLEAPIDTIKDVLLDLVY